MIKNKDIVLALISGAMLVPAFPPFDYYLCAWVALVPLLLALRNKTPGAAFLTGFITGFVYFLGTLYWVSHSMYYYGYLPVVICVLVLLLLCAALSVYTGIFSVLFSFIQGKTRVPALIVVPVLWVSLEYVRTYVLTGLPWSSLGYSQYKLLPLIQISDITGIYGVSFLVAALSGAIFDVIAYRSDKTGEVPLNRWPLTLYIAIYAVVLVGAVLYGSVKLQGKAGGQEIKVSLVQGNIEQDKKWDLRFRREVIDKYKKLTAEALKASPDIIIWPETAVPFVFNYDKKLTEEIVSFQKELGTHLLFGSITAKYIKPGKTDMSNSAILLSPKEDAPLIYDKIHMVPYGEYVPLRNFFPFITKLAGGIGDFLPGKEIVVMETPFAKIGNVICYEIIFPGLVRKFVDRGADVLVTITNDAWFGHTSAPYQHFSMAVFRAIENRVPVARAANTGISGFIDSRGRILDKSNIFVEAVMNGEITVGDKKSFYTKYGDIFVYICIISAVLLIAVRLFSARKAR